MTSISSATISLSCPLWACDFDPEDPSILVVGGGGGSSNTGLGNKLSILELVNQTEISKIGEFELKKNEDNISTLAVGPHKAQKLSIYAGANSTPEDLKKGTNQHFRVFSADLSQRPVVVSEVSRAALFQHQQNDVDTYQRLLRLSQPQTPGEKRASTRLGAVATGFGKQSQIALFTAPSNPGAPVRQPRARIEVTKEAVDLDVVQTGPDDFQLAYCDRSDLFTVSISPNKVSERQHRYSTEQGTGPAGARSIFKNLRYLTSESVLAIANRADRKGSVLLAFRVPPPSAADQDARVSIRKTLPSGVVATGMAIRVLSPASSWTGPQRDTQFIIAISSNDNSILIYTLDMKSSSSSSGALADLRLCRSIKAVHSTMITALSFSTVQTNHEEGTPDSSSAPTPHVKLASVSMGQQVVVHSIPLRRLDYKPTSASVASVVRYTVALKPGGDSHRPRLWVFILLTAALIPLFSALIGPLTTNADNEPGFRVHLLRFDFLRGKSERGWLDDRPVDSVFVDSTLGATADATSIHNSHATATHEEPEHFPLGTDSGE
ncbi:hypothetical protein VTK73DRAFT_639 [Phialemonium thermophilum]|uniref:Guanine nucleotide-exchange factor SEC12 n=1 Tax=Phialemonium thermophilum TaxID=223376 RepID=A0ABR3XED3_9PEZI